MAANYRQIPDLLRKREAFTGNSMTGLTGDRLGQHMTGRLEGTDRARFLADAARGITYLVVSYATPIAWVDADGSAYVVAQHFSRTTSRQQTLCRAYL